MQRMLVVNSIVHILRLVPSEASVLFHIGIRVEPLFCKCLTATKSIVRSAKKITTVTLVSILCNCVNFDFVSTGRLRPTYQRFDDDHSLKTTGQAERTLPIVTIEHGERFQLSLKLNEPMRWRQPTPNSAITIRQFSRSSSRSRRKRGKMYHHNKCER